MGQDEKPWWYEKGLHLGFNGISIGKWYANVCYIMLVCRISISMGFISIAFSISLGFQSIAFYSYCYFVCVFPTHRKMEGAPDYTITPPEKMWNLGKLVKHCWKISPKIIITIILIKINKSATASHHWKVLVG